MKAAVEIFFWRQSQIDIVGHKGKKMKKRLRDLVFKKVGLWNAQVCRAHKK